MNREHVSALMDSELEPGQETIVLNRWKEDEATAQVWNEYHLIGDILREKEINHVRLGQKVALALADEPTVLAPVRHEAKPRYGRWLAMAAAVAAVSVSTWTIQQQTAPLPKGGQQLAAAGGGTPSRPAPLPEAKPYVAMHRQWSPLSGFQTVEYDAGALTAR